MINPHNVSFLVNLYDKDGDKFQDGIFINVDRRIILKFKDTYDIKVFIDGLDKVIAEITENNLTE